MAQFRVSFNMVLQQQGWSYQFYRQGDSASAALRASLGLGGFQAALLALHNPSVYLHSVSVAQVPEQALPIVPRNADQKIVMLPGTGGLENNRTPDVTSVSVMCRLNSAAGKNRNLWLRGLPDAWTLRKSDTGVMNLHADFKKALDDFIGVKPSDAQPASGWLNTNGFQTRYILGPENELGRWKDVATISSSAGGARSLITTEEAHGWTVNQNVLFSLRNPVEDASYSGEFRIIAVPAPNQILIAAAFRYDDDPHAPQLMRVRRAVPAFTNILGGEPVKLGHRDTGRPKNLTRGREPGRSARRA